MRILYNLGALALTALSVFTAEAGVQASIPGIAHKIYQGRQSGAAFKGSRSDAIVNANSILEGKKFLRKENSIQPDITYGPTNIWGDVDGPDGKTWFYTLDKENDEVHYEYFTEYFLKAYTLKIYNEKGELVGTIKDRMRYGDDEKRVPYCDILPLITTNFFNDDDKYEIMMGFAINTSTPGIMHYRTVAYQIGGEKDSDGNDMPIAELPELVADVLDATLPGGPETHYLSLVTEVRGEEIGREDDGKPSFWEKYVQSKCQVDVYMKAGADGKPRKILTYDIPLQQVPGDQESGGFAMTKMHDSKPYIIFSKYADTFSNPFYSMQEDMSQRENNALSIDIYRLGETPEQTQHTDIPFNKDSDANVLFSFHSIGSLRYTSDIKFGADGKASFILTKGNRLFSNDEQLISSYYHYGADGALLSTLFEGAESHLSMADLKGFEPQEMFVTNGSAGYMFHFVDLDSGTPRASISYQLEVEGSDPDRMTANIDRVAVGDSYMYADELRLPSEEDDVAFLRIVWLDADGKHQRTDEVNMGKNVHYAMSYIESGVLHPDFYLADDKMEYMILIKRGQEDGTAIEEVLVGQARSEDYPDGRDLFLASADESKGVLDRIAPYHSESNPMLMLSYYGYDGRFIADFYNLPFSETGSGVEDIIAGDNASSIRFNGDIVSAEGLLEVFDLQGRRVAEGLNSINLNSLSAGIYVVKAGGEARKINKK